jgi:NitT/TauT family transport system ATP-binding protein
VSVPKLSIKSLTKRFKAPDGRAMTALDAVSFDVQAGEFIAFVGPSGCGKTTMLRIIQGLETATSGSVEIDGRAVTGAGHDRGFVFQSHGLLPWLTAAGNIAFALEAKGVPTSEHRSLTERVLATVGLTGFGDSFPHQLSGGMQQRVGIARALAIEPDIMLLDEPFGALDALTREVLQNEVLGLTERLGKTVLFVTHSVDEAVYLADRVVVMSPRPGRIRDVVPIEIPRPRASLGESIRDTPAFARRRRELWEHLMQLV